jgi:hypothetical protein
MSSAARKYQAEVTGVSPGYVYRVGNVKLDAEGIGRSAVFAGRAVLVDAKSLKVGSKIIDDTTGRFANWIAPSMERQALRQVVAADGRPIEYWVQSERLASAWRRVIDDLGVGERIRVVVVP